MKVKSQLTLALLCVVVVLASHIDADLFKQTDSVVWLPTDYKVETGLKYLKLHYKPLSICELRYNEPGEHNVSQTIHEGIKVECFRHQEKYLNPVLNQLASSQQQKRGLVRNKRCVDPISCILGIIAVITIVAVGCLGYMAVKHSGELDLHQNRITALENRTAILQQETMAAQNVRQQTIAAIDEVQKRVSSNTIAIKQMANIVPLATMTASEMYYNIREEAKVVERIAKAAQKHRASPKEFADLFQIGELNEIEPKDTKVEKVYRDQDGLFHLDIYFYTFSNDTIIKKIDTFQRWVNITTNPTLMEYAGPEYIMYNATSNCARGIYNPSKVRVFNNCLDQDYRDEQLTKFVRVDPSRSDFHLLSRPKIIKTFRATLVSCFYFQIKFTNVTYECPPYHFELPSLTPFSDRGSRTYG